MCVTNDELEELKLNTGRAKKAKKWRVREKKKKREGREAAGNRAEKESEDR